MAWNERILEGAISTPDGQRFVFDFEDVEINVTKNTSKYTFSDIQGTYVQDFGLAETSLPLTIYFSGADYDRTADTFLTSVGLRGICILEHPKYGIRNVVVSGINRKDNLKSAAGQAVFVLEITETILDDIPESDTNLKNSLDQSQSDLLTANSESFASKFLAAANDAQKAKNRLLNNIRKFKNAVKGITDAINAATESFEELSAFIESNIDFLLTAPLQLATALQRLYNAPALFEASVKDRIKGYSEAYKNLGNDISGNNSQDAQNQRAEQALLLIGIIASFSTIYTNPDTDGNGGYLTKNEAISNAQALLASLQDSQEVQDKAEQNTVNDRIEFQFNASDSANALLKNVVSDSIKWLLANSFDLNNEIIITLDRDYTIIDLCYELYNTTDNDAIDFLINTNALTGESLIIIPKETVIKYYA